VGYTFVGCFTEICHQHFRFHDLRLQLKSLTQTGYNSILIRKQLNPRNTIILEILIVDSWSRYPLPCMATKCLLTCLQQPTLVHIQSHLTPVRNLLYYFFDVILFLQLYILHAFICFIYNSNFILLDLKNILEDKENVNNSGCPFSMGADFRTYSALFVVQQWAARRETVSSFTEHKIHAKPTLYYSRVMK
jgi:hypothetical protein